MKLNPWGNGYSWGDTLIFQPSFKIAEYQPPPVEITLPPTLAKCNLLDCLGGILPSPNADLYVAPDQHMVIDKSAISASNSNLKLGRLVLDGTLEIPSNAFTAGDHFILEISSMLINSGMGPEARYSFLSNI